MENIFDSMIVICIVTITVCVVLFAYTYVVLLTQNLIHHYTYVNIGQKFVSPTIRNLWYRNSSAFNQSGRRIILSLNVVFVFVFTAIRMIWADNIRKAVTLHELRNQK